jgi:hypothetical protein
MAQRWQCASQTKRPWQSTRAGRVAQVVERLPSKHEVLSSNPSAAKQTNKQTNQTNKKNQGRAQGTNASQWLSQTPQPVREAAIAVLGSFLLLFLTLFYALFFWTQSLTRLPRLGSKHSPISVSWVAGITHACNCTWFQGAFKSTVFKRIQNIITSKISQVWWHLQSQHSEGDRMIVSLSPGWDTQELQATLSYLARPCLKIKMILIIFIVEKGWRNKYWNDNSEC